MSNLDAPDYSPFKVKISLVHFTKLKLICTHITTFILRRYIFKYRFYIHLKYSKSRGLSSGLGVLRKLRAVSSNLTTDKNVNFEIFACFAFLAARPSQYT